MVIAVDFDGTCVSHKFPEVGIDIGAAKVLKKLVNKGHKLILYTMRSNRLEESPITDPSIQNITGAFLSDARRWFKTNNIPLYAIQVNPEQKQWTTSPKCYADLYIDDAALGCPLVTPGNGDRPYVDWEAVEEMLISRNIL